MGTNPYFRSRRRRVGKPPSFRSNLEGGGMVDCLKDCNGACCKYIALQKNRLDKIEALRGGKYYDGYVLLPCKCSALDQYGMCTRYKERPVECVLFRTESTLCKICRRMEGYNHHAPLTDNTSRRI